MRYKVYWAIRTSCGDFEEWAIIEASSPEAAARVATGGLNARVEELPEVVQK